MDRMVDEVTNEVVKTPKVTLLTYTGLPLETVYSVWEASKGTAALRTPEQIREQVPHDEVRARFQDVIAQGIPIGEHVYFVFMFEHVSVSWREHAVRHRIGVSPSPEIVGADMAIQVVPDRATSSFWSQSARILDMGAFADNHDYRVPQTLLEHPDAAILVPRWRQHMIDTQNLYNFLTKVGIPMEDAREAIPIAMQHRMSWSLNVQSLRHILHERGCWILQLGIWGPVIEGMVAELVSKVDPVFASLVTPPCLTGREGGREEQNLGVDRKSAPSEWIGCRFHEENKRRYTGEDKLPPCALHVTFHASKEQRAMIDVKMLSAIDEHAAKRERFWHRDPRTGHKLHLHVV